MYDGPHYYDAPHYKYLHHSFGSKISDFKYTLVGGKAIIILGQIMLF
jgi:hypothetical protein